MLTKDELDKILEDAFKLVIDGGLGTELEKKGHDLNHPLWSGKLLIEDPAAIRRVHLDYFLAGANIAITASYQASLLGLTAHLRLQEELAMKLIKKSVLLAKEARLLAYGQGVPATRKLLVAGSVGPYGAFLANGAEYTGEYGGIDIYALSGWHQHRIEALIAAGVDFLMLETIPNILEIKALVDLLSHEFPYAIAMLSCTLKDSKHISDGTPLKDVIAEIDFEDSPIVGFGVNCVPPELINDFLQEMDKLSLPLFVYPNSGETYHANTKTWSGDADHNDLAKRAVDDWFDACELVGGCCRTTPADIVALRKATNQYSDEARLRRQEVEKDPESLEHCRKSSEEIGADDEDPDGGSDSCQIRVASDVDDHDQVNEDNQDDQGDTDSDRDDAHDNKDEMPPDRPSKRLLSLPKTGSFKRSKLSVVQPSP